MRKEKPYQLEDRVEQLFHEKSVTGYSAWNRLFDETIAACASRSAARSSPSSRRSTFMQDTDGKKRKAAAEALAETFKENLRPFALITNTLAKDKEISDRWRGFKDVADARHLSNRVEPEVVEALVEAVRAAYPKLSHRYYALKAKWFGKKTVAALGPQRAAAEGGAAHDPLGRCARDRADRLRCVLTEAGRDRRPFLRRKAGSTRRCAPASSRAPSRIRPCRRRILMCCSITWASRAT